MNINELKKVYNRRNCVERIIFNHLNDGNSLDTIIEDYLDSKNLTLSSLKNNNLNNVATYALYVNIVNKYVRRNNVTYLNITQINKMLDTGKDTIYDFIENDLDELTFKNNFSKFIEWIGVSKEFHEMVLNHFTK